MKKPYKFIDLFAGLGGFHLALERLGCECVFASELDKGLREVYERNFDITPEGDIRDVNASAIPTHDILCAGFPCQPFSKAGEQEGLKCPKWGSLFEEVLRIIKHHQPKFLMLENVPNLEYHDNGRTWEKMKKRLESEGYDVKHKRLSPDRFGIPQIRERMFIVAQKKSLNGFAWPEQCTNASPTIVAALDKNPQDAKQLTPTSLKCLRAWQKFLQVLPRNSELPSFPIWSMEFGADYPFEETTPFALGSKKLRKYKGCHGIPLAEVDEDCVMDFLPSYARREESAFPKWKIDFIRQNRAFYKKHQAVLDNWKESILEFPSSLQKFEWNCKGVERDLWKLVIQFRASGVRVKRPTTAPSLIAMTTTQVPVIGWEKRYMLPRECARLQSMDNLNLPTSSTNAFKALGNAVNASLVEKVARSLLDIEE